MKWINQKKKRNYIKKQSKTKKDYIHANKNKQADKKRKEKKKKVKAIVFISSNIGWKNLSIFLIYVIAVVSS